MAESHVLAASIGLALAGVMVLSLLAGCTVTADEIARADARIEQELRVISPPKSSAPTESTAAEPEVRVAMVPVEPVVATLELVSEQRPTSRGFVLPPVPVSVDSTTTERDEAADDVDTSGVFTPRPVLGDIRSVDFRNGFTYPIAGVGPVTVTDGYAKSRLSGDALDFMVDHVVYGDATDDGGEDVVVGFHFTDQWGENVSLMRVFSIQDGLLEDWGWSWADYGALERIAGIEVATGGVILVDSISPDATAVTSARWAVQGHAVSLQRIEVQPGRAFVNLAERSNTDAFEIDSAGAAVRAVVIADGGAEQTVSFRAESGWVVAITPRSQAEVTLRVRDEATGLLVGDVGPGSTLQVGAAGRYVGQVIADSAVTFDLEATDQRTLSAPTWVPRSRTEIVEDPARREVRLLWPEFTAASGAANLDATNAMIRNFVDERVRAHQSAVDSTCELDERSMLSLSYRLTMVSYDLVSIDFAEFVCLCESGDYNEAHVLTIDLNTGQRLDADQLFVGGIDAVTELWWQQLTVQSQWVDSADFRALEPVFTGFNAVSLSPHGVTMRAALDINDGGSVDVGTYFSFDDLAGLINPAIATRAASGAAVALPIEEGCGC